MRKNVSVTKILFLASNPQDMDKLRLDREARDIKEGLRQSKERERFVIESEWAVRPRDIRRAIQYFEPNIVHFSGHGEKEGGLAFEDQSGQSQFVSPTALSGLFKLLAQHVKCVVLNACYSEEQADAIAQHVSFVIGMSKSIGDQAAIEFSVGFYDSLGAGCPVEVAYEFGCNAIQIAGIKGSLIPVLKKRKDGISNCEEDSPSVEQKVSDNYIKKQSKTNTATIVKTKVTYEFVLSGSIDEIDKKKLEAIVMHLRKVTGDMTLTLLKSESGSIKLTFEGSEKGFEVLQALVESGSLHQVENLTVQKVTRLDETAYEGPLEVSMKVTQENLPDSQVGLEIEVPAELTKQSYEKVLQDYVKSANIPGFRKGKVPRQILIQRIGSMQLKAAALEDMLQKVIGQAVKQEEIEALGNYQLRSDFEALMGQFEPGKPLTLSASVDVPPRVTLSKYKDLAVQAEEIKPAEGRVDETIESYRENLATLVPIEDRAAAEGDVAVVDFVGKARNEDGELEEFEGGNASDFQVEIKEGRFIPGFVEGIVGMQLEEEKDVEVTFPEDYPEATLAGQPATFSIKLNELKEKELPDVDDEFAEEVSEFETLEELRNSLEERYEKEAADATDANVEQALLDELVKHIDAEIPDTLIKREVDFIVTQTAMQLSRQGIDLSKFLTKELVDGMRSNARPEAVERLRRTLALGEIAKQESIKVEDDEIKARTEEMMAEVEDPSQVDPDRLNQVVNEDLLKEKILAWLKDNAKVELVPEGTLTSEELEEFAEDEEYADEEATVVEAEVVAD